MALILEIIGPDGQRTWRRLDGQPVHIGRGYSNDIIVDDPYVDARHARIVTDEAGVVTIEDLGSVNGLVAGDSLVRGNVGLRPRDAVRIGRTVIVLRDADEEVPPALRNADVASAPAPTPAPMSLPASSWPRLEWIHRLARAARDTKRGHRIAITAMIWTFSIQSWLTYTSNSRSSVFLLGALGLEIGLLVWCVFWSIASRIVMHRSLFVSHLAVASAAGVVGVILSNIGDWLSFLFPDSAPIDIGMGIVWFAWLVGLLAGHLSLSSRSPSNKRWRTAFVTVGLVTGFGLIVNAVKEEQFSDAPTFSKILKPMPVSMVPTRPVDEFSVVMSDLKRKVDKLAEASTTSTGTPTFLSDSSSRAGSDSASRADTSARGDSTPH
jgi:hypothetical protein